MHPNATVGKTVKDIVEIYNEIINLIERKYNADTAYRDPIDPPVSKVYKGEPAALLSTPAIAVVLKGYKKSREPDGAGSEVFLDFKIICYGSEHRREPQQDEAIRMAQAIEQILIDSPQLQSEVGGTEYVFHVYYEGFEVSLDQMVSNFTKDEFVGLDLAELSFKGIVSEEGY